MTHPIDRIWRQSILHRAPMISSLETLRSFGSERLLRVVRRSIPLIVIGGLTAATASFVVSKTVAPEYQSTAQLYIAPASNPTVAFQDVVLGTSVARSYVQLLTSEVVLRPAMETIDWTDLKSFRERTTASQIRDTSIITVTFRGTDPTRSADAANAVADSFIKQTRALQSSLQGTTVSQLEVQIRNVEEDISALGLQITALRNELSTSSQTGRPKADVQAEILQLDGSRQAKQQTLAQLLKTRDDMRLAAVRAESAVSLWQPATVPLEPTSPKVALNVLLGLVAGCLLTFLVVSTLSYFDDRISDFEVLQSRVGLAPLGQVHLGEQPNSLKGKLFLKDSPRSQEAEALRSLRTNIQFSDVDRPPRIIVVTSALPREGKSVVSANLALAFAQAGVPTVLVDADLRRPSQHRLFGVSATFGLTSLLTDSIASSDLRRFEVMPNLHVVPSGPLPPNPAELLSSAKMTSLLVLLSKQRAETMVIVDTSPVMAATDAAALATKADGTLFVIDAARTRATTASHAVDVLRRVRAHILGAVLNKISSEQVGYYYYQYYGTSGATPRLDARRPPQPGA